MKLKQLIKELQKLQEQGTGVDDNWPVYLFDGEIVGIKAYPSKDGIACHVTEANEIVLELRLKEDG